MAGWSFRGARGTVVGLLGLIGLVVLARCSSPTPDALAGRAAGFVTQGRISEAIVEYRKAIQADPKRGDLRLKLSDLYTKTDDLRSALDEAVKAADLMPTNVQAQLRAGSFLLMARQFEDAKTRANALLNVDPKNVDGQILLGNALAGLEDLDGALAEYQNAIAANPTDDTAYTSIAAIHLGQGRSDQAEASFRRAIAVAPRSIAARMALGNFLWASGRAPEAEQAFKDVLAIDPKSTSANRALGVFYVTSKRPNEAEPYFRAVADVTKTTASTLMLADYYGFVKRYGDSRRVLASVDPKDRESAATLTRVAALDAAQGNRAGALARMKDILAKYPKDPATLLTNARLLRLDGKGDQALAVARAVAEDETDVPAASDAYLLIGRLEGELGHRSQAISAFEAALRLQPQLLPAALSLASLHLAGGDYDEAKARASQALAIHPGDPEARTLVVRVALARKDVAAARTEVASLARDYPNSATVLNLRAGIELEAGQTDEARRLFAKAAAAAPGDIESEAGLIGIDLGTGHTADALGRVESDLDAGKPSAASLVLAARTYAASGQTAKAEGALKRAIAAEPANLEAYGLLGQLYIDQHRVDEAETEFQQLVTLDPRSVSGHTMLGMLLDMKGRSNDAEIEYQHALRIDPRAAVASNNLAWIYADGDRNLDEALQLARSAQEQLPDEPHVNDTLGWVYYRKKVAGAAIKSFEASLAKDPEDPATHYHLGMAYALAGDRPKARLELQRALAPKIEFSGAADARAALARMGG